MDGTILILADRLSRERTAALFQEYTIRRRLADRGIVITPARPVLDTITTVGVWFRELFAPRPRVRYL